MMKELLRKIKTESSRKSLKELRTLYQNKDTELLEFVQDYMPIQDVRNGIIETKDKRYIKILEIEPINFMLKSPAEQYNIICNFASWLKISPLKMQFKSITRKADSEKYIRVFREELEKEKSIQCQKLGEDYINLIKDVGNKEALTRRFFLIFQYEPIRKIDSDNYADVMAVIGNAAQTARAYFAQCGNVIITPDDPDMQVFEILYTFFNRASCIEETLYDRADRVIRDAMKAEGKTIGVDDPDDVAINLSNYICPRGLDLTHINYIIMDGMYFTFIALKSNGYPAKVHAGWISALVNAGEGVDVDIFLTKEERSRAIDKVSQKIRLNKTKIKEMQDTSSDYEEVAGSIQSGYYIKNMLSNYNEDFYYMTTIITISAKAEDTLLWRKQQVINMLKSSDMFVTDLKFQQEEAFKSVMPLLQLSPLIERKTKRNLLTSGVASTFMFTSYEMSDDNGVLLGINRYNNSLCIVDLFNTKKNKNANLNLIGTSGSGKTFTMQLLALRMRMRGIQNFIVAPIKGHEFRRTCNAIGGEFIKIAPGSPNCINIMEIRHTITPEMKLIDEIDYNELDSMMARKVQQLMTFFSLLIPDITNEEEQMLDEAIMKTYKQFGITADNESLYVDKFSNPPKMKKMPILGDLHKNLTNEAQTKRIATIISRFVTGSAQSFNQQTNVDLDNDYIVLDLSELKGRLLPVGMFIALDYVWDRIKMDRTKKKAVMIDEIWQLIGASSNKQAADFCLTIFKTIRGFGGAAISATQDLSDFFGLDDGKYGRAIINNSKNKIILNLEPDEAKYVQDVLNLTNSEIQQITRFDRGEALVHSNNNKVPVYIRASEIEREMITTDRADLESILRKRQLDEHYSVLESVSDTSSEYTSVALTTDEENVEDKIVSSVVQEKQKIVDSDKALVGEPTDLLSGFENEERENYNTDDNSDITEPFKYLPDISDKDVPQQSKKDPSDEDRIDIEIEKDKSKSIPQNEEVAKSYETDAGENVPIRHTDTVDDNATAGNERIKALPKKDSTNEIRSESSENSILDAFERENDTDILLILKSSPESAVSELSDKQQYTVDKLLGKNPKKPKKKKKLNSNKHIGKDSSTEKIPVSEKTADKKNLSDTNKTKTSREKSSIKKVINDDW